MAMKRFLPKSLPKWYMVYMVIIGGLVAYRMNDKRVTSQMTREPYSSSILAHPPLEFPRILHQTWKTCDGFNRPAHEAFTRTWREHHPEWKYRCWTDNDNRALIEEHLPQYLEIFDDFPREIYRVDFVRAAYMYVHGGVYADYDFVSVKPLDPLLTLLSGYGVILGTMGQDNSQPNAIANAFMISKPRHPFWLEYMEVMRENKDNVQVVLATGPDAFKKAIITWHGGRPLHHPGEYARITNGTKIFNDPAAQPLYIAAGGMFYPLIWDRQRYENLCCPRDACLNGREQTSCDELSSMAKAKGSVTGAEYDDLLGKIASCTREMCQDTYAYTVWLSVWKDQVEDNI